MRIIIINHYSGSLELGMEYRHFYLAQEFKKLGHEVCIVASVHSHLRRKQPSQKDIGPHISLHQGIDHIWLTGCEYASNDIRRMLNMLGFSFALWWYAKTIAAIWKPDVVYASSPHPLQAYGGVRLARVASAKFVFEIRDLWPLSLIELAGVSPAHVVIRLFDHAEQYGCKQAVAVISLLPMVADYMTAFRNLPLSKLYVIPNGISQDDWQCGQQSIPVDLENYIKPNRSRGDLIIGYAGSFGHPNALDALLDAAVLLRAQPVCFVLVGEGHEKARLQQRVDQEQLENVRMFPSIPKAQIPKLLECFDCAYLGAPKSPIYRFGVSPNKLLDYMMAGVPVLYAIEAGNDLVAEAGCGLSVPAGNPNAIAEAIDKFIQMGFVKRTEMGQRGHHFVIKNLTYSALAKRLIDVLLK